MKEKIECLRAFRRWIAGSGRKYLSLPPSVSRDILTDAVAVAIKTMAKAYKEELKARKDESPQPKC